MFKKLKKPSGSNPNTPKISTVPLPEIEDRMVFSAIRDRPPKVRWREDCMSDGELLTTHRRSSVRQGLPLKTPPKEIPVRPAAPRPSIECRIQSINLHWLLLPYDPRRSKGQLLFNIARHIDKIRLFVPNHPVPRPLSLSDLQKPAAENVLTNMTIVCPELPWWWCVVIGRPDGIRIVDVLEGIRETFYRPLTDLDRENIPLDLLAGCQNAFKRRCKTADGPAREEAQGLRRVDLLNGKTRYMGLACPAPHQDQSKWVLQVGRA